MKSFRTTVFAVAAILGLALVLTGCGSGRTYGDGSPAPAEDEPVQGQADNETAGFYTGGPITIEPLTDGASATQDGLKMTVSNIEITTSKPGFVTVNPGTVQEKWVVFDTEIDNTTLAQHISKDIFHAYDMQGNDLGAFAGMSESFVGEYDGNPTTAEPNYGKPKDITRSSFAIAIPPEAEQGDLVIRWSPSGAPWSQEDSYIWQ